jgi:hypothetical protein
MDNKKRNDTNVSFNEKEDFLIYLCNVSNKKENK